MHQLISPRLRLSFQGAFFGPRPCVYSSNNFKRGATVAALEKGIHAISEEMTSRLISEEKVYSRYLSVFDRKIQFTTPSTGETKELQYDVVGHPRCQFKFSVIFPFHPAKGGAEPQVTLIREYCQGPHVMAYCLPTGGFDPKKHVTIEDCALAELSEEALLCGGELVRLIPQDHAGLAEVKWCANRFVPFLVINPEVDQQPGIRDLEEVIHVLRVDIAQLRQIMTSGDMMLPSITTCFMALEQLKARGLLGPDS